MNNCGKIKFNVVSTEKNYQILDIKISEDGVIEPALLKSVKLPQELRTDLGVIINGKAPIWLYAFLVHELHPFAWVATFDPRIGAIIVENHVANGKSVGDTIASVEEITQYIKHETNQSSKKRKEKQKLEKLITVVGGPPHSGKSVFIQALREKIRAMKPERFYEDFFIIRACPDGEGDWFGEIPENQGKVFRYKGEFTDEFASKMARFIENTAKSKKVVLVDVGGRLDRKNLTIFSNCNSGIIVSRDKDEAKKWNGTFELCELETLALIHTVQNGENKTISAERREFVLTDLDRSNIKNIVIPDELVEIIMEHLT